MSALKEQFFAKPFLQMSNVSLAIRLCRLVRLRVVADDPHTYLARGSTVITKEVDLPKLTRLMHLLSFSTNFLKCYIYISN